MPREPSFLDLRFCVLDQLRRTPEGELDRHNLVVVVHGHRYVERLDVFGL